MHRARHALLVLAPLLVAILGAVPTNATAAERRVVHGTLLDLAAAETARSSDACLTATQLLTGTSAGEVVADGSACGTERVAVGTPGAPCVGVQARAGDVVSVVDERSHVVARPAIGTGTVQDPVAMTCRFDFTVRVPTDGSTYTFTYAAESGPRSVTYTARQLRRSDWSVGLEV